MPREAVTLSFSMQPEVKRLFDRLAEGKKQSVAFQQLIEEVAEARAQTDAEVAFLQLEMQRARLRREWRSPTEFVWADIDRSQSLPAEFADVEVDVSALSAGEPELAAEDIAIATR
ncbi:MAG TPA: hypothetical protein VIO37_06675 [Candidatus Dormibacteraeota bacterium]|jgi:hypothetical protein